MSKDKREAGRVARRAKRLAERAEERAMRKERQAERAAERAARLAERATRRSGREQDRDPSLEDLVDKVAQKAERWIDEQTKGMFDSPDDEREVERAETQAEKARKEAQRARQSADKASRAAAALSDYEDAIEADSDFEHIFEDDEQPSKRTRRHARRGRQKARSSGENRGFSWAYYEWPRQGWPSMHRCKSARIYRDRQRKKICGVCAGLADYLGRPAWEIRLYAVLGLFFIPSITIPSYFISYFFMDDKPYYKRVTDRFDEDLDSRNSARDASKPRGRKKSAARQANRPGNFSEKEPVMNNVQAIKTAKRKFSDIEQRLRRMESHVTSSKFELQREFRKISGEN